MLSELEAESDRGAGLIAVAWVDDALGHLLRQHFVDDDAADALLIGDVPLATFSAKIKMAYALGCISKEMVDDLTLLRKVRNEFAHDRTDIKFTKPSIKDRCNSIKANDFIPKWGGARYTEPRDQYVFMSVLIAVYLMTVTDETKRPGIDKGEGFELYLKKYAEHTMMQVASQFLDKAEKAIGEGEK